MKNLSQTTKLIIAIMFALGLMQCGGGSSDNSTDVCEESETTTLLYITDEEPVDCNVSEDPDSEIDTDADGITDDEDNCPSDFNPSQADDGDNDSIGDACDNCPYNDNENQTDIDGDGTGDDCDEDRDGDGVDNDSDVCPDMYSDNQTDTDGDGHGDDCDDFPEDPDQYLDTDGDGISDSNDNCPYADNADQCDTDADGEGNTCDEDDDNDSLIDEYDLDCPYSAGDCSEENDQDGDGVADDEDNCPSVSNVCQADSDNDGVGDSCETDDGMPNSVEFTGVNETIDGLLGQSVASSGDLNGDNIDDLVIGAPAAGRVYIIYGQSGYHDGTSIDEADVIFTEENSGDYAGYSVAIIDDMNEDGKDELLIGAYKHNNRTGRTYLIYGAELSGTISLSDVGNSVSGAYFFGENENDYSGFAISSAGDVDGDGKGDFLIGAYNFRSGSSGQMKGRTYLIYGTDFTIAEKPLSRISTNYDGAKFTGENTNDYSGRAVSGTGDTNGDGCADFIIGTNGAQKVYFFYGICGDSKISGDLSLADTDHIYTDSDSATYFGSSLSPAGDTNGDGYDDFLIGAKFASTDESYAGKTYLVFGKEGMAAGEKVMNRLMNNGHAISFDGNQNTGLNSTQLAGGGDFNGDGYTDIAMGTPNASDNAGNVYMFLLDQTYQNSVSTEYATNTFTGNESEYLGMYGLSLDGDINGDGYTDLIIGSPNTTNEAGYKTGKVIVQYGQP